MFGPMNHTKPAANQEMTFFFFFGDHPFERADFVLTIVEKPINLAWCKVAIHCPAFCFSKYGNPIYGLCLVYCILMY